MLALFRLFRPVSETLAWQMVILGALVSVPIMFVNVLNEIAALILVSGPAFLTVFDRAQLEALALPVPPAARPRDRHRLDLLGTVAASLSGSW